MDADVRRAIAMSHLRGLPPPVLADLVAGAVRSKVPAGAVTHREGEGAPHIELVVSGVVRVFVTAPDGRTMTIRYCRSGALIGVMSLFSAGFTLPATIQALVDADVLRLSPRVARTAVERDVRVARALLAEQSERALNFVHEIAGGAFATMRQRVARHLLDLASERASECAGGHELAAPVTQRELADAVGTVREVVVRVLRELRGDGLVRTERDRIVLVDPEHLTQELGWNRCS
ncbi:Crp/Fnr family transcriptional regulator [Pseudonocardia hierapolitana]|nr:Crp/Fnr family transcriptional regulator [Pseudonocardia hierapolitana]